MVYTHLVEWFTTHLKYYNRWSDTTHFVEDQLKWEMHHPEEQLQLYRRVNETAT